MGLGEDPVREEYFRARFGREKIHLKCWPEYFEKVLDGSKPFEIRKNDRDFRLNDTLVLAELNPEAEEGSFHGYSGRKVECRVTYITPFAQVAGYVVMGIKLLNAVAPNVTLAQLPPILGQSILQYLLDQFPGPAAKGHLPLKEWLESVDSEIATLGRLIASQALHIRTLLSEDVIHTILRTQTDPGAFIPRFSSRGVDNTTVYETLYAWQARALELYVETLRKLPL